MTICLILLIYICVYVIYDTYTNETIGIMKNRWNKFHAGMFRFPLPLGLGAATEWFSIPSESQQVKKKTKPSKRPQTYLKRKTRL